ncbi:MAG: hypothetical protein LBK96_06725, partial [Prevotellaceae bacterium]|nr:hypothetical protein [Prevotellaceae bacterium]
MNKINDRDDFPKLIPDKSISFDAKDELKRSAEMNFECSELEYKIRLTPDTKIVMPDKQSLKHKTFQPRLVWLSLTAAAILAFVIIVTNDRNPDFSSVAENGLNELPAPVPEVIPEINPETETELESKTESPEMEPKKTEPDIIPANEIAETISETDKTDEQDFPAEMFENKNDTPRPENIRIEQIPSLAVSVEMMKKEKTVFVYKHDYQETMAFKAVNSMASTARKLSSDINTTRHNITQVIDGFKIPNILGKLSLDRGIDREIDKWAKEHPDIPFSVFVDYHDENKIVEIYDENG